MGGETRRGRINGVVASQGGVPLYINRNKSLTIGQPCSDQEKNTER